MPAKPKPDASKSSSDSSKRKAMPFVPKSTQVEKKSDKKSGKPAVTAATSGKSNQKSSLKTKPKARSEGIPEVVSRRMVKRVALFCGIPTALGMSTFIGSYLIVSNDWFLLPTYAVLLVSLLWFGLGVLGISYGVLSASWDEEITGSWLGFSEFRTNWGRMTEAWRANRKQR